MAMKCLAECQAACCKNTGLSDLSKEQVEFYTQAGEQTRRPVYPEPALSGQPEKYDIAFDICPFLRGIKCAARGNSLRAADCTKVQPGDANCSAVRVFFTTNQRSKH